MRFALTSLSFLLATAAFAADPAPADKKKAPDEAAVEAAIARAPIEEQAKVTAHTITIAGKPLAYHATAGTLTIRDVNGKPTGSIFYVAYTADGAKDVRKRPVTFFYNGGPGSASLWLHMGSLGPMRIQTANPEYIKPAPYDFGPNPDTLLDTSDLVFIDAMGTGYSRPLGDAKNNDFFGVDQDADTFARAIMRYLTINGRWNSPKFLFGESYGTTRSGALAYQLEDRGVALNGVVILSSILNYGIRQPGYDQTYIGYLPSFAATAWYHNRVQNRPADVATFVQQAREFAVGAYASALAKGATISPQETDEIAQKLGYFTGLSPAFIKSADLRISLNRFRKELLRDRRLTLGRYDSRYTGVDPDAAGESPEFDASDTAISGAFIATLSDYLSHDLGYKTDMLYRQSASELPGYKWDFTHKAPGGRQSQSAPDVAVDLSAAMRINPYLKLMSANGYYDMATPFFSTEYDLNHMLLGPDLQKNIEFHYYPSGHMVYLNPDALHALKRDTADFINRAVAQAQSNTPPVRPTMSNGSPAKAPN
jgi:carboxypeptidase C (cathepsin A)